MIGLKIVTLNFTSSFSCYRITSPLFLCNCVRVCFVLFSDPPNYNGGAPILGYTLEMENTTTKGSLSKNSFNFFPVWDKRVPFVWFHCGMDGI